MKPEKMILSGLIPEEKYRISLPPDPGLHEVFVQRFPGIPPVVVNGRREIIAGSDSYDYYVRNNISQIGVLTADLDVKDSLFLACNARAVIKPLSLLEKLNALFYIAEVADIAEIYRRTNMGIRIDETLLEALPDLLKPPFRGLLKDDRISLKTANRMLLLNWEDRKALAGLFGSFRFSASNELNLIDMITEICFRDKISAEQVLRSIQPNSAADEEDPARAILMELSRMRYPSYSETEEKWKKETGKIKVPFRHTVRHSPFFEKKGVELRLFLDSLEEIKQISRKLKD